MILPRPAAVFTLVLAVTSVAVGKDIREPLRERVAAAEERVQASPEDAAAKQELAEALYFLATTGKDGKAAKRAEGLFTALHEKDVGAAQPTAYLGSLKLLRSSSTWAVWEKEKLARQGLAMLDEAVEAAPEDLEVRFIRAVTTFNVPDWFERGGQSAADFALIAEKAEAAAKGGTLEPRLAAAGVLYHGRWLERQGDKREARAAYELATRIDAESHAAAEARESLVRLTE